MLVRIRPVVIAIAAVVVIMLLLVVLPGFIVKWDLGGVSSRHLSPAERTSAANDVRTTILQALGGIALIAGAIVTWRQMQITRQQVWQQQAQFEQQLVENQRQFDQTFEAGRAQLALNFEQVQHTMASSQEQLEFNREALLVDRLSKAGEQIASQDPAVRIAGIYAVEQIARLLPGDRRAIARIIAALITSHAPWTVEAEAILSQALTSKQTWAEPWPVTDTSGRLPVPPWIADLPRLQQRALDVTTALDVLLRMGPSDRGSLTFENVDLRKLDLDDEEGTDLARLHFPGAHFEGSYFVRVDFSSSRLHGAHFEGAHFVECKFPIEMGRAHLDRASVLKCTFHTQSMLDFATARQIFLDASLAGAMLNHADLRDARHIVSLEGAWLDSADLRSANLMRVNLSGSKLRGAWLQGADLRGAKLSDADMAGANLRSAVVNDETKWPDGFQVKEAGVSKWPGSVWDAMQEKAAGVSIRPLGDDELWSGPEDKPGS